MKVKFCDPSMCEHCTYICSGDFVCDLHSDPVLVVSNGESTEEWMRCERETKKKSWPMAVVALTILAAWILFKPKEASK